MNERRVVFTGLKSAAFDCRDQGGRNPSVANSEAYHPIAWALAITGFGQDQSVRVGSCLASDQDGANQSQAHIYQIPI